MDSTIAELMNAGSKHDRKIESVGYKGKTKKS